MTVGTDGKLPPALKFGEHAVEFRLRCINSHRSRDKTHRRLGLVCQAYQCFSKFRGVSRLLTITLLEIGSTLIAPVVVIGHDGVAEAERFAGQKVGTKRTGLDDRHEQTK